MSEAIQLPREIGRSDRLDVFVKSRSQSESSRRQHIVRASPSPVAAGWPGTFMRASPQVEQVLQGRDREGGMRRPCQSHQLGQPRRGFRRVAPQVRPEGLLLLVRQRFEPAASRVVVMRAGVNDGVGEVVMRQMRISRIAVEGELKDARAGQIWNCRGECITSGVIIPRSSAMNGRPPNSLCTASKKSAPGPGTHCPDCAVGRSRGTCHAAANRGSDPAGSRRRGPAGRAIGRCTSDSRSSQCIPVVNGIAPELSLALK